MLAQYPDISYSCVRVEARVLVRVRARVRVEVGVRVIVRLFSASHCQYLVRLDPVRGFQIAAPRRDDRPACLGPKEGDRSRVGRDGHPACATQIQRERERERVGGWIGLCLSQMQPQVVVEEASL